MHRGHSNVTPAGLGGRLPAAGGNLAVLRGGVTTWYSPPRHRALRALIADDDRDTADSLAMLVWLWGHAVRVAYDGATALDLATAYRPDVLLLDIGLPRLDGYMLARLIRQQTRFDNALLIAISGHADRAHRLAGEAAGFDHYLAKPADPGRVEQLLLLHKTRLTGWRDDAVESLSSNARPVAR